MKAKQKYSVIVPALNADTTLVHCLRSIQVARNDVEVIVVDGGSTDLTRLITKRFGARLRMTKAARGVQLHAGTQLATGDIFLFLHADTYLPQAAFNLLDEFYSNQRNQVATFRLKFDHDHWLLKTYGHLSKYDSLWTSFGDQGISMRRDLYEEIGGFPQWRLFEDVELLKRTRRRTKVVSLNAQVTTSSDRFLEKGLLRQQFRNGWLILKYLMGVSHEKLSHEYNI